MNPLAQVIELAQRAQQSALTPEQHAADAHREAIQRRSQRLTAAHADLAPEDIRALVFGTGGTGGGLRDTPHLRAARAWLQSGERVLLLSGTVGCGKSVAAGAALAGLGGAWVAAADLVRILGDFDRGEARRLTTARCVVVDDVGDELQPERFGPALKHLFDKRVRHGGRLVLTTNLPPAELQRRYPDTRLWSRVAQSRVICATKAPDLRREG